MKPSRSLTAGALVIGLLAAYFTAYLLLAERDQGRARGAGAYFHYRNFSYDFEIVLFTPAAFFESLLLRACPKPFINTNPSWASSPQVLILRSPNKSMAFGL